MVTKEQELFELVEWIGETLSGKIHIIETTDEYPEDENDKSFRVYHDTENTIRTIANPFNVSSVGVEDAFR